MDAEDDQSWPLQGDFGAIVRNSELTADVVPTVEQGWGGFAQFALTIDGYAIHGSFGEVSRISDEVDAKLSEGRLEDVSLTDLRTWLFFEFRAQRHTACERFDDPIWTILDEIRRRLPANQG